LPTSCVVTGRAWRAAQTGHVSLDQLKVISAIKTCRTAALGGQVEGCEDCGHQRIAYNSCRNRHCPKCQGAKAREWLAAREADLLPVGYFHVVFSVPAEVADIALNNKAVSSFAHPWPRISTPTARQGFPNGDREQPAEHHTHHPQHRQISNPHKPRTAHRGFVLRRLSHAKRRPKLLTIAFGPL
jgi:hypothetical protein